MSQSETTLLEAVNRVLLDVGERTVTTITSPASQKARNYLQDAVRDLAITHDWEWLYNRITATTWLGNSFTIPTTSQVRGVAWIDIYGNTQDLQYVEARQFDLSTSTGFYTAASSARPYYYTIPNYQTISVNPYPLDATGQGRVVVYTIEDLTPPKNATDLFPLPEKYLRLVIIRAAYYMSMRHLEDSTGAQFFDKEYNELLDRYRSQEHKTPTGGFNMYRRRTRRYFGGIY